LKITPKEFVVDAVGPGRIKLAKAAGYNFEKGASLLRPLGLKVNGNPVYTPFSEFDVGLDLDAPSQLEGQDLWINVKDPKKLIKQGDVLRSIQFSDKKERIANCGKPVFEIPNNAIKINNASIANLISIHALVNSGRFSVVEPDLLSIKNTNDQLKKLFFKDFISEQQSSVGYCYTPAIWIKDDISQCSGSGVCSITGSIGSGILIDKEQKFWKRELLVSKFNANDIDQNSKSKFFELKAFEAFSATAADFSKKLSGF